MHKIKSLLSSLIACPSITPHDAGCQQIMMEFLTAIGFHCEIFNSGPVSNFFASRGTGQPALLFAGHTDVVPAGDLSKWQSDPFKLHEENDYWLGRGVADMKGSLACMLIAAQQFVLNTPNFNGTLGFLITSGEEGDAYDHGTPFVMQKLHARKQHFDYCIVGEPSSSNKIGDVIKIGRRGSLTASITLQGKQGHVAYPHLAINPIHQIAPVLTALTNITWDTQQHPPFPPTSLQITHIQGGGEANNIIPGELRLQFNLRYSIEHNAESLQKIITTLFQRYNLHPHITWQHSGQPFLTAKGRLLDSCIAIIEEETQQTPELSTSGGTSDGRFIAPYGIEVIELGPVNKTIHQINEKVCMQDLHTLTNIYHKIMETLIK